MSIQGMRRRVTRNRRMEAEIRELRERVDNATRTPMMTGTVTVADTTTGLVDVMDSAGQTYRDLPTGGVYMPAVGDVVSLLKSGNAPVVLPPGSSGLKSFDYIPGLSGWQITAQGDVEFNNGLFRGTLIANTLTGDGVNLIVNGDAELGTTAGWDSNPGNLVGWAGSGAPTVEAVIAENGNSIKMIADGSASLATPHVLRGPTFAGPVGRDGAYKLRCRFMAVGGPGSLLVAIEGSYTEVASQVFIADDTSVSPWRTVTFTVLLPENAAGSRFAFGLLTPGVSYYFDNMTVERVTLADGGRFSPDLLISKGDVRDATGLLVPVGAELDYGGDTIQTGGDGGVWALGGVGGGEDDTMVPGYPPGFVPRDGREVDRDQFNRLFAVFGERYGAGDGSTTFGLPDAGINMDRELILDVEVGGTTLEGIGLISQYYRHLGFRFIGQGGGATGRLMTLRFNTDSGANYYRDQMYRQYGDAGGSTGFSANQTSFQLANIDNDSNRMWLIEGFIPLYTSTTFKKMIRWSTTMLGNATSTQDNVIYAVGSWENTAAINDLTFAVATTAWAAGSRLEVWGEGAPFTKIIKC